MRNHKAIRSPSFIIGVCAFLMLNLAACSSVDEGDSEPISEEQFGGNNRDMAPAHQEKERERGG